MTFDFKKGQVYRCRDGCDVTIVRVDTYGTNPVRTTDRYDDNNEYTLEGKLHANGQPSSMDIVQLVRDVS